MGMLRDFTAQFDESMAVVRSSAEGPNIGVGEGPGGLPSVGVNVGPITRNIPGLAQQMPPQVSRTSSKPVTSINTAVRQLTGLTINRAKNPGEKELDRLGILPGQVLPKTGDPAADRLIAIRMGPLFEQAMPPVVQSGWYKSLGPATQKYVFTEVLTAIRQSATKKARGDDPELFAKIKILSMPETTRNALNEVSKGRINEILQHLGEGK